MRQSVIKNRRGEIVKYNHSKWLAISGVYSGKSHGHLHSAPGSANWADFAYTSDEQTQQIFSSTWTGRTSRHSTRRGARTLPGRRPSVGSGRTGR